MRREAKRTRLRFETTRAAFPDTFKNEGTGPHAWPFDKAFYLKLNIAVGGGWGGQKGIDNTIFPQQMLIDYVRVYQQRLTR